MAMRRTLKRLHRFGVVDQGGVLYYNDIIATSTWTAPQPATASPTTSLADVWISS